MTGIPGKQVSAWLIHEITRLDEARLSGLGARQVVLTRGEAAALCAYIAALEGTPARVPVVSAEEASNG